MKEVLNSANGVLKQLGYKKKRSSFWKIDNGFYKLINFQGGAYGGYFFVNVAVHPVGLPRLFTNQLSILDHPKEYECIIRQRIEQIVNTEQESKFSMVFLEDEETIQAIINSLPNDVEQWLKKWGSYEAFANVREDEISYMLSASPIFWRKAYLMVKFYCTLKMGDKKKAIDLLEEYMNENVEGFTFVQVDDYLKMLVET